MNLHFNGARSFCTKPHIVYIAPFTMVIVAVQVYNFDPVLEDAARDCGASSWEVYRHVTIPLLWPGIFSAAIFAYGGRVGMDVRIGEIFRSWGFAWGAGWRYPDGGHFEWSHDVE